MKILLYYVVQKEFKIALNILILLNLGLGMYGFLFYLFLLLLEENKKFCFHVTFKKFFDGLFIREGIFYFFLLSSFLGSQPGIIQKIVG